MGPVYTRIAQFILNNPIDGEQSIIPKLITTGETLPKGQKSSRRDRLGQYYDRLMQESDAMKKYFTLMQNDAALQAFLTSDWPKLHPGESAPKLDAVKTQMWNDYALLGGHIPKGGPTGVTGFVKPRAAGRPFHPKDGGQKDPASGFLTIPREVVLGLGQAVPRWGAIDFGIQSGDVMHFDDRKGIGKPFFDANATLSATAKADYEAAVKAEAGKKAQQQGGGSGSGSPTQQQGSGSAVPTPQRKAILGAIIDPLEQEADVSQPGDMYEQEADKIAEQVMRTPSRTHADFTVSNEEGRIDRKCSSCKMKKEKKEDESLLISRKPSVTSNFEASNEATSKISNIRSSGGSPLDKNTQEFMESRFGYDFSRVRIHRDTKAADSAQSVNALAYTLGEDIVFGDGQYSPRTAEGRRLLAHELIHVMQQNQTHQIGSELVLRGPPPRASTKGKMVPNPVIVIVPTRIKWKKMNSGFQEVSSGDYKAGVGCLPGNGTVFAELEGKVIIRSSTTGDELVYSFENHKANFPDVPFFSFVSFGHDTKLMTISKVAKLRADGTFVTDSQIIMEKPLYKLTTSLILETKADDKGASSRLTLESIQGPDELISVCEEALAAQVESQTVSEATKKAVAKSTPKNPAKQQSGVLFDKAQFAQINYYLAAIGLKMDKIGYFDEIPGWTSQDTWRWYARTLLWNDVTSGTGLQSELTAERVKKRLKVSRDMLLGERKSLPLSIFVGELRRFEDANPGMTLKKEIQLIRRAGHENSLPFDAMMRTPAGPEEEVQHRRVRRIFAVFQRS